MAGNHTLASLVSEILATHSSVIFTDTLRSNIRKAGVPQRNGKEDIHNRTEPLEKPEISQLILRLAGVEAY
jgi:hypothetical protein